MKIKPGVQIQKQPKVKTKINKKRLFFIFFSAFVGFFFLCTLIASLLTPKIDVPALDNESNLSSVSSDDFKGRVDPRLKLIEMDGGLQNTTPNNPLLNKTDTIQQTEVNLDTIQNDQGYTEPQNQNDYLNDQLPYDSREPDTTDPATDEASLQDNSIQLQPQKAVKQVPKNDTNQNENLILRDKVKVQKEPASMNKVLVGNYSDLTEARRVSQELTNSDLNVTPFIKEINGSYSLQVGTFSNPQKAAKLASDLRKRNLDTRIIKN
ncbi:MAG: SPOR domain-containing protein [Candidatus Gastranaerophilales bacterium]|nr:SPOR domain-containing protein [Candidatus Gastranaerophilales bacterium]